ncbi:unannotated protein [freshwater metagenome]|uniref:Unannotated protein n=1 Tax=freshwater metagenome TaxID=449393 RepID=A0A6J6X4U5_9ZZZZ
MTSAQDGIALHVDGPVATVTLSRPDALNALTPEMLYRLAATLEQLAGDDSVRVVVLTGEGRAFSAGVDLKSLAGREIIDGSIGEILDIPARRATTALAGMPKVTIAKVNGFCFTGALEIAIACDLVFTADEAKLGDTHVKFGIRPSWGMNQRLIRLVGPARARDLSFTARTFSGAEAAQWGLATASAPREGLDALVQSYIDMILPNHGPTIAACKDLYRNALDRGLSSGLAYEAAAVFPIAYDGARLDAYR